MIRTNAIVTLLLIMVTITSHAQVDTLYAINPKNVHQYLTERTDQYLVFFQNKKKKKQTGAYIWSRSIRFKKHQDKDVIEIEQKWYSSDSTGYRYVYSLVDRSTFLPLHHRTWMQRTGTEAFDFYADKIVGSDTVANNSKAGFVVKDLTRTTLNWELDLETFSLLSLKANKRFAINFYHPGGRTEPKLYEYKVIGDTTLPGLDGASVPCWKLRIDYAPNAWAIFYISKKNHEVVKMEEEFGSGVRYKVKLPGSVNVL